MNIDALFQELTAVLERHHVALPRSAGAALMSLALTPEGQRIGALVSKPSAVFCFSNDGSGAAVLMPTTGAPETALVLADLVRLTNPKQLVNALKIVLSEVRADRAKGNCPCPACTEARDFTAVLDAHAQAATHDLFAATGIPTQPGSKH